MHIRMGKKTRNKNSSSNNSNSNSNSGKSEEALPPIPTSPTVNLEDELTAARAELEALRVSTLRLESEIEDERTARQELTKEKNLLAAEIEDLTKVLFEEANGMVAVEAKARHQLEQIRKKLESDLEKTRDQLRVEAEQTKFLRDLLQQQQHQHSQHQEQKAINLEDWNDNSSTFAALLEGSYYEDFLPARAFHSRDHQGTFWDSISRDIIDSDVFAAFSAFVDDCYKSGSKLKTSSPVILDNECVNTILGHEFMRGCISQDVEPCLQFALLERAGKTKSFLKKLLPAMLRNSCIIEALSSANGGCGDSIRGSPVSVKSVASARPPSVIDSPVRPATTTASISISGSSVAKSASYFRDYFSHISMQITASSPDSYVMNPAEFLSSSPKSITASFDGTPSSPTIQQQTLPNSSIYAHNRCSLCLGDRLPSHRLCISAEPPRSPTKSSGELLRPGTPIKSSSKDPWKLICSGCRERLVAVATFFTLLRHLLLGLHCNRPKLDIFYDLLHVRRYMFYARCGLPAARVFAVTDYEEFARKLRKRADVSAR